MHSDIKASLTFRGTMSFEELLRTGGSSEKQKVQDLQRELQSDDPINIQFTSVSADRGVARIFQRGGHTVSK